ncbi:MAG: ABC transporter ATP-binding protein [Betaproteobacteria bacterium]|nr:ABC transporter ATP-binding protein [Betaproteobacteria bacterium]
MTSAAPLLELVAVENGYGISQVLFDISFSVAAGECVSVQGRNGMGKSTTVKSILGIQPVWRGGVRWKGQPVDRWPPHRIARQGVGLVPEGRQIFPNLTVRENLIATAVARPGRLAPWDYARVVRLFPRLAERANNFGNQLSGGEQQMLAIGRALMTNPELLILDEATEGLSPLIRQEIWNALATVRAEGMSILVIDKNLRPLLELCDRHLILEKGRVVWSGSSADLRADHEAQRKYLSA